MRVPRRHRDTLPATGLGVNLAALAAADGVGVNRAALGLGFGSEAEFQAEVIRIAERGGWAVFSVPDSRRATCGGYPDLTLMHPTGPTPLMVAELKREGEQPRADQEQWLSAFRAAGIPAFVWTPDSLTEIREVLK